MKQFVPEANISDRGPRIWNQVVSYAMFQCANSMMKFYSYRAKQNHHQMCFKCNGKSIQEVGYSKVGKSVLQVSDAV